ncbi:uncharacterized protein CMU_007310 [Cryptosporidium muris RN66]|uniref:Ion transport domain-containing protein n=1 Tax=Cryptosporidium muris (strain RN66) TaxID=441375 RepID=B6ADF1_CRYMR|nr:uncharacterized protein CMU_007310 [Cryptosporidium muris RN66]EEA06242.1 hypothetical protein CMU_007310 [Cryptosporidium muris RN66]|eukprot:XP_002140591.1 hypothetical protein [Cryptosporidium muris RN66]
MDSQFQKDSNYFGIQHLLSKYNPSQLNLKYYNSTLSYEEITVIIAKRLYYSEISKFVYLTIFLLNIFVFFRGFIGNKCGDFISTVIEVFITSFLLFEVIIKIFLMGNRYFIFKHNFFDFCIMLTCVTLLLFNGDISRVFMYNYIKKLNKKQITTDVIEQILTSARFLIQAIRTYTIAKYHGRTESTSGIIDFENLKNNEDIGHIEIFHSKV